MIVAEALAEDGHASIPAPLLAGSLDAAVAETDSWLGGAAGRRRLLNRPLCRALAEQLRQRLVAEGLLAPDALAVQCTLFDKTPQRNWPVVLHQDISIPAASRRLPVTWKEGEPYVQPGAGVLRTLLAVRLHLDACDDDAGPLRVVPGSHRWGILDDVQIAQQRALRGEVTCLAARGDVLLMHPLLLHASSRARRPSRRRVLHFLFGPLGLPSGLVWNCATASPEGAFTP